MKFSITDWYFTKVSIEHNTSYDRTSGSVVDVTEEQALARHPENENTWKLDIVLKVEPQKCATIIAEVQGVFIIQFDPEEKADINEKADFVINTVRQLCIAMCAQKITACTAEFPLGSTKISLPGSATQMAAKQKPNKNSSIKK